MFKFSLILILPVFWCLCSATEHSHSSRNALRHNRTSTPPSSPSSSACLYKEMMTQINDRVGLLSLLDENQRTKLEALTQKVVQFETNNLGHLESISEQQIDTANRIESMEHTQNQTKQMLQQLKGEFDILVERSLSIKKATEEMDIFDRQPRQASNRNVMQVDDSTKLEALAILLTSTRQAVGRIQDELDVNLTRLFEITSELHRRVGALPTRRQFLSCRPAQQPEVHHSTHHSLPVSCAELVSEKFPIQRIQINAETDPFYVNCDQTTDGGGWTIIQHRSDGVINFNRPWVEYKTGFGNIAGDFFIGLDKLNLITSSTLHELLIVLVDFNDTRRYARYNAFAIGSESEYYPLHILGAYDGDAGDSFSYHASQKFSTFDNDNDGWVEGNCAQSHTGAWWYNACEMANLNGQYLKGNVEKEQSFQGMYWIDFNGASYSLKSSKMMIRPVDSDIQRR